MSIQISRKTLNRASAELHHAKDEEGMRQAAEKGWRAAREAVYAVISVVEDRPKGTMHPSGVVDFEHKHFGRVRGRHRGQPLADGYARAGQILHGLCFYDATCPRKELLEIELKRVDELIDQAEDDVRFLESTKRGRKKRR